MKEVQCANCSNKMTALSENNKPISVCRYKETVPPLSTLHNCEHFKARNEYVLSKIAKCLKQRHQQKNIDKEKVRDIAKRVIEAHDEPFKAKTAQDFLTKSKETMDERGKSWTTQEDGNHYKDMVIQPMQLSMENKLNALQHTIIKYVLRYDKKHKDKTIDLKKAKHCLEMLIEWEEK